MGVSSEAIFTVTVLVKAPLLAALKVAVILVLVPGNTGVLGKSVLVQPQDPWALLTTMGSLPVFLNSNSMAFGIPCGISPASTVSLFHLMEVGVVLAIEVIFLTVVFDEVLNDIRPSANAVNVMQIVFMVFVFKGFF
jgi:hypothetical protein